MNAGKNQPQDFMAHYERGNRYYAQCNYEAALASFNQALRIQPKLARAYNGIGLVQHTLGNIDLAGKAFQQALNIHPGYFDCYVNIGKLYLLTDRYQQASQCFSNAIKLKPDHTEAHCCLATVFRTRGEHAQASEYYNKALKLSPNSIDARVGLASLLEVQGEFKQAMQQINGLLKQDITDISLALLYAKLAAPLNHRDDAIRYNQRLLKHAQLAKTNRTALHFCTAKLYDANKNYDQAFAHYKKGNQSVSQQYELVDDAANLKLITQAFNKKDYAALCTSDNHSERPVFIIGMPRSGTSLVEKILASHPQLHGAGELKYISDLIQPMTSDNIPDLSQMNNKMQLNRLAEDYLTQLPDTPQGITHVTDKMPYNFKHLGFIHKLFPNARIIHCTRNPIDTCLSCYFQNFLGIHSYSYSLKGVADYYLAYQAMMQHWKHELNIPMFEIRYEDMVHHQEEKSRELLEYCGLEWDEQCLTFYNNKHITITASSDQVRQPIYQKSVERWRHYEKHISTLIEALPKQ